MPLLILSKPKKRGLLCLWMEQYNLEQWKTDWKWSEKRQSYTKNGYERIQEYYKRNATTKAFLSCTKLDTRQRKKPKTKIKDMKKRKNKKIKLESREKDAKNERIGREIEWDRERAGEDIRKPKRKKKKKKEDHTQNQKKSFERIGLLKCHKQMLKITLSCHIQIRTLLYNQFLHFQYYTHGAPTIHPYIYIYFSWYYMNRAYPLISCTHWLLSLTNTFVLYSNIFFLWIYLYFILSFFVFKQQQCIPSEHFT